MKDYDLTLFNKLEVDVNSHSFYCIPFDTCYPDLRYFYHVFMTDSINERLIAEFLYATKMMIFKESYLAENRSSC